MPQPCARNAELPLTVVGFRVQFDGLDCLDTSDLIQIVRACGMAGQHIPAHTADTVVRAALTRKYVVVLGAVYTPSLSTPLLPQPEAQRTRGVHSSVERSSYASFQPHGLEFHHESHARVEPQSPAAA